MAVDARFANNPLVTGDPHIRFYAKAPLLTPEDQSPVTLCALDTVPHQLSPDQREVLRVLTRQVMTHLELHRTNLLLGNRRQKLEGVLRITNGTDEAPYVNSRNEIFVEQDQRLVRVTTADLQYVEVLDNYVNLHPTHERLTVYGTVKDLVTKLPVCDFVRIHHKYIVRLGRIMAIEGNAALLDSVRDAGVARPPVRVPIGSSYKAGLLGRLNLM